MVSVCAIVFIVIGALFAGAGGFLGFYLFPKLVDERIEETVKLIEGSDAYNIWQELPIPIVYKIYFFNVSNPDEVQNGGTPIVSEIGPYIYNQQRVKMNITQDDVDVLSYYQHMMFEFDADASYPLTEFDEITIANLPLLSVIAGAEYDSGLFDTQLGVVNSAIPTIFSNPTNVFLETTPRDFIFDGLYLMCDRGGIFLTPVCNTIAQQAPITMPRLEDGRFRFSLLNHKNDTHEGHFSINSGVEDVSRLGDILSWEGSSTIDIWKDGGRCNDVYGTDASIYPPFNTKESGSNIFNVDICRSLQLEYSEEATYAGIEAYRYIVGNSTLASPNTNPENECFCLQQTRGITGDDGCLLDGAMELWNCLGPGVVGTLPHFYGTDEQYQNGVEGLSPNASLHEIFVELEPSTGVPLRGSKRFQFNIFLKPTNRITLTTNLKTTLMPVVWIDEGFEMNDELIAIFNTRMFDILKILDIIYVSLILGGGVICFIGTIWLLISCCACKKEKPKSPESS